MLFMQLAIIAKSDNAIYVVSFYFALIAYPILSHHALLLLQIKKASNIKTYKDSKKQKFHKTS